MNPAVIAQAAGLFAITNIDDIVILALFFAQARSRSAVRRVVAGQYLGFVAILCLTVVGVLAADLLPLWLIPYLGLVVLALGLVSAWRIRRERRRIEDAAPTLYGSRDSAGPGTGVLMVTTVTFANGGDNIGVYIPVFAATGTGEMVTFILVFLVLVAAWCAAGYWFAHRQVVARRLARWSRYVLPIVLIGLGLGILIQGGAFGL